VTFISSLQTARLKGLFQNAVDSRLASFLLLCAFFWIVAAASHSGFMGKWGLRDNQRGIVTDKRLDPRKYGIESMLDGTAIKPFVYRQFAPILANLAERVTPNGVKEYLILRMGRASDRLSNLGPEQTFARATSAAKPEFRFRYMVVYYLSFFSLFLSLFVLRQIALDVGVGRTISSVVPAILLLSLPYLQTFGGYFYDNIELLFMSLAFLVAIRGSIPLLIAITIPATLNKESFIFYLPALYPLLRRHLSSKMSSVAVGIAVAVAALLNAQLKLHFLASPGGTAELHFVENIKGYLMVSNYFRPEVTYGIIGPQGAFAGTLAVIVIILFRGWPSCPRYVRQHLLIAAAINFPLFLIFCITGELRNLSLMYVGFVILIAFSLERKSVIGTEVRADAATIPDN
jgi:hypothetical protein